MKKLKYAVSTFFAPSGGRCSRHHTMNPRRELLGLLITSHSCTCWPLPGHGKFTTAVTEPEVGWDNTIDTDFKKLSVGPVKGGRPPFFFWKKPRFRTFLWFYLFYLLKNLIRWGPMARFATLLLIWLASLRNLAAWDAMADGELGGILVWRMVRMSRLAKFYDKASVIKVWAIFFTTWQYLRQYMAAMIWKIHRSVNIVNISTRFGMVWPSFAQLFFIELRISEDVECEMVAKAR